MTVYDTKKRKYDNNDLTIDVNTLEKDNKVLRAALYANVIFKSQQQVLGQAFDEKEMKNKAESWEKQVQEEKSNSKWERDRKKARMAIESIKRSVNFDDALQAERDLLVIIGATS